MMEKLKELLKTYYIKACVYVHVPLYLSKAVSIAYKDKKAFLNYLYHKRLAAQSLERIQHQANNLKQFGKDINEVDSNTQFVGVIDPVKVSKFMNTKTPEKETL